MPRSLTQSRPARSRHSQASDLLPRVVPRSASDDELSARQTLLRQEAAALLEELDRSGILAELGPLALAGSYLSELMSWRDLDVMLLVGADYSPKDVLQLISQLMDLPGVVGFDYRDERARRSPTGQLKDERYHIPFMIDRGTGIWRLDLTLWLHDLHQNVTAWHESLRDSITGDQRAAVLRIKDVWFRLPNYPDQISGLDIYTAVIEDDVRTPSQFNGWLAARGLPVS
jgi:hypothetical protein